MQYTGIIRGKTIEFNKNLPFGEGVHVKVEITKEEKPQKNSPKAWVKNLAGTLTEEEADIFLQAEKECRKIDWEMWEESEE